MLREELIFVGNCDIAGHVRGKGFPARELRARKKQGIGWTHSNLMQTAFGPILDTPFGTGGDLMVVPDMSAEARVDFADGTVPEHFILGDIRNTDGSPWECCPREFLRRAIAALDAASGLHLIAAFEQEFVYTGVEDRAGHPYSLGAWRAQGGFGGSSYRRASRRRPQARFLPARIWPAPVRIHYRAGAGAEGGRPGGDCAGARARHGLSPRPPRHLLANAGR